MESAGGFGVGRGGGGRGTYEVAEALGDALPPRAFAVARICHRHLL